jgi:geranylgeranyl diphosphate synthase type II
VTQNADFTQRLALLKPIIWRAVESRLPGKLSHPHYQMVQEYPRRQGKYFRPTLFLLALELFGATWQNHIDLAAALQLCEDWLLIHDDVEDQSDERRGKPSLNSLHGSALAINAGDTLHMIMWKTIYDYLQREHIQHKQQIFNQVADMIKITLEGQFEELWWIRNLKINIPYKAYYEMIQKKTCYYTIIGPIRLAGIIAGLSEAKIKSIETWGIPFGKSFQIQDDVLDVNRDVREGKRTLLLLHLLKSAGKQEGNRVADIYKKDREKKTSRDIKTVMRLMRRYNSLEYAARQARGLSNIALQEFKHFSAEFPDSPAKSQIPEAIKFVVTKNN